MNWADIYQHFEQPLHLDIGCAKGHFVSQMASLQPGWNFLGLEIRAPLVEQALQQRDRDGFSNLHFLFSNANVSLAELLETLPSGTLQQVSIQFPDPWFKKRHQKRRVVQPELVQTLAQHLPTIGRVVLQSDVESVAQEMCDRFGENPAFQRTAADWLADSPFPAQTDRELLTLSKGLPVFRAIFTKSAR
ncbi:MAG: tRNA (guanosine(46)-N7)-methyltransferase TrmB [Cyanobacteria bacterium P01_C01_bin.120]